MHRNRTGSRYEELSVDMDVSQGGSQGGRYEAKEDFEAGLRRSTLAKDETDLWASLAGATVNGLLGGPAQRRWLHVDALGTPTLVEVDKHLVVQQLGVRYRDLLTLDPTVPIPFPAAILIRPKALVVNLETVRMVICSNQCYVLSVPKASDEHLATYPTLDSPFIRQLCRCLRTGKSTATLHDLSRTSAAAFDFDAPYELRALEVALATVTNTLDAEAFDLEKHAFPAVDRLATNVSREVLEEVRGVKQVMGRLVARVQRLKAELEEILNDDADMQDMYLARRAMLLGEDPPPAFLGVAESSTPPGSDSRGSRPGSSVGLGKQHTSEADVSHAWSPTVTGMPHPHSTPALAPGGGTRHAVVPDGSTAERSRHRHAGEAGHHASGRAADPLPVPAREHLGHHTASHADLAGSSGSRHSGHAGGKKWHKAGTVVRTIRTLKRRPRRPPSPERSGAGGVGVAPEEQPLLEQLETVSSAPAALSTDEPAVELGRGDGGSESGDEVFETIIENPAMPAVDPHEIEDAEDLLESYFIQIDYILRRLLTVSERIDDTEDLVAIKMDHRRNELVATDLGITVLTAGFAWVAMIAGIFGMNLSPYPQSHGYLVGVLVISGLTGGAIVVSILAWIRHRGLMFIPTV